MIDEKSFVVNVNINENNNGDEADDDNNEDSGLDSSAKWIFLTISVDIKDHALQVHEDMEHDKKKSSSPILMWISPVKMRKINQPDREEK